MTCVEFKDLGGSMRTFGMLAALEAARNLMYRNFERGVTTWLYIDEVQSLSRIPPSSATSPASGRRGASST